MTRPPNAMPLHWQLHHHAHQYYVLDAPEHSRRRVRPPVPGAAGAGGRAPRTADARFAHPARGRQGAGRFARCATRCPCCRIRTETDTEATGARTLTPACASELGLAETIRRGIRGRAQVRRPGHEPALRTRRAGAGRHPRRRRDRRRRHAEHPHHRQIPLRLPGRRAGGAGGAGRGLHAPRRLRGPQRAPARQDRQRRKGREDLRQPAQCRRRCVRQLDPAIAAQRP
jgi:DNA ligase (NAD+)